MTVFLSSLLIIAVVLEGTVTTLPLTLVALLYLTIQKRSASVFAIAFLAGFFLDILTVRTIGVSSLIFLMFVFLILLYQKKYEINSYLFVFFATIWGSLGILLVTGRSGVVGQVLLTSVLAVVGFVIVKIINKKFVIKQ